MRFLSCQEFSATDFTDVIKTKRTLSQEMSKKAWNRHRRIIFVTKKDDKRIIGEFFSGKRKKKRFC